MNIHARRRRFLTKPSHATIGRNVAEVHDLVLTRIGDHVRDSIPTSVLLINPLGKDASHQHLYIDRVPVPRDAFRYDSHDKVISWTGVHGGGHINLSHDGMGGYGNIGQLDALQPVSAGARAIFDIDIAIDVGASYITSGGIATGLAWDVASPAWKAANWTSGAGRLRLTYTVTPGGPIMPPTFSFEFEDTQTQAIPWDPTDGAFAASLQLSHDGGAMDWALSFKSSIAPPPDQGSAAPASGQPDSVYPYWLQAIEDAAAASINGVIEVDNLAPNGTLVGMSGHRATPSAAGYYAVSPSHVPFSVFDGKLYVGDAAAPISKLRKNRLSWSNLPPHLAEATGLPAQGIVKFSGDGSAAKLENGTYVKRLTAEAAHARIAQRPDIHPQLHANFLDTAAAVADPQLNMYGLLAMNTFAQNSKGEWSDVVQAAVTADMSTIMNSFVPASMWQLLFPTLPQTPLSGECAIVANSPVPGVSNPTQWYEDLATAVLVQGMANGSDQACKLMNGPRAAAWLKSEVATSKVYYTHSQMLFQYEWQQRFPLTEQYQQDQINNAATYASIIDAQVKSDVADITANVIVDANSPADLKKTMIADVTEAGEYAKENNLYWAFAFYVYNTAPSILANIALQMGINTGSSDGMTLTRMFQQNAAVLTALDPSGFFSKKYTDTISTFLSTNIVPSMYSFENNATTFDVIKEYLETFVQNNLNNENQQIQQAAQQIAGILAQSDADEILKNSITALNTFSQQINEALSFPYVANNFVKWFSTTYPKLSAVSSVFGSVLMTGIAGLAFFNMVSDFRDWSKLTKAQRAQLILNTIQFGLQFLAAVVTRGVRIYALYSTVGLSRFQRAAGISRILVQGEAEDLDAALARIGNTTARWLGDTQGSLGQISEEAQILLIGEADVAAEEVTWAAKIFGKNLDEFIATRIGPIFILAGIGFSIYQIATGDSGVALASDILNLVSGSLMLFATVGGWLVEGGVIAAEGTMAAIVSCAGPLAVVLALVGVGLMLYEMFKKPPDPVQEFVDQYAAPAQLAVSSQANAIDYVMAYVNKSLNNLLMIGCTFNLQQALRAENDHTITCGVATALPNCVWQVSTDGQGVSQIFTVIQPDQTAPPVTGYLTGMSDNSVCFAAKMQPTSQTVTTGAAPTPVSQSWFFTPSGSASVNGDGQLVQLTGVLQVVMPDSSGNFAPSGRTAYLAVAGGGVQLQSQAPSASWTLTMSGMAPNYVRRPDISFVLDSTPSAAQSYSPSFGVLPSTPVTTTISGSLPNFLTFDSSTGVLKPNGQKADTACTLPVRETVANALGSAMVDFRIIVHAAGTP